MSEDDVSMVVIVLNQEVELDIANTDETSDAHRETRISTGFNKSNFKLSKTFLWPFCMKSKATLVKRRQNRKENQSPRITYKINELTQ